MERTMYTNDYCTLCTDEAIAERIVHHYELMGELIDEDTAAEYIMWDAAEDWSDFLHELNYYVQHIADSTHFLTVGRTGRWEGVFEGGEVFSYGEFEDVLYKMLKDCETIIVKDIDGILQVEGIHHDGRICYQFKGLTAEGYDLYFEWTGDWEDKRTEREIHSLLWNNPDYTENLNFYDYINEYEVEIVIPAMA